MGLLEVVLGMGTPALVVDGLATLAARLTEALARRAMTVVDQIADLGWQTQARLILAAGLPRSERAAYVEAALEAVPTLDDLAQANVLGALSTLMVIE